MTFLNFVAYIAAVEKIDCTPLYESSGRPIRNPITARLRGGLSGRTGSSCTSAVDNAFGHCDT